jgi:ribokinase
VVQPADGPVDRGHVVVVGSANVDLVVPVPRHPGPGETVLGGDLVRAAGGKGANQAVAACRAGGARTTFVGAVGRDESGELLLASLSSAGVDTTPVVRADAATGTALISVGPAGENVIVVAPGANARLTVGAEVAARLAEADVVLAQLEVPVATVVDAARARRPGARLVLNAAPSRPIPTELWDEVDVLVVNEHEAGDLVGPADAARPGADACAAALLDRVPAVVVTLGARGCLVAERGRPATRIAAPRVDPVDATGAGDTFCGVLAAHLARGAALTDAARVAVVAGALAVTRPGAQDAVPDAAAVDRASAAHAATGTDSDTAR